MMEHTRQTEIGGEQHIPEIEQHQHTEIEQKNMPEVEQQTEHPNPDNTHVKSESIRYDNADSLYE